jgi:hypothetical protein
MRDQFELATTVPSDEPCVQIGEDNYSKWSRLEAYTLIEQLIRQLGEPPSLTFFKVISCSHDFGTYYDVAIVYDDDEEDLYAGGSRKRNRTKRRKSKRRPRKVHSKKR